MKEFDGLDIELERMDIQIKMERLSLEKKFDTGAVADTQAPQGAVDGANAVAAEDVTVALDGRVVSSKSELGEEVYHDGLKKYCEEHNLSPEIKHSMVGNKCQVALTVGGEKVIAIAKPYFQESLPQVLKRASQKWMETHASKVKSNEFGPGHVIKRSQESGSTPPASSSSKKLVNMEEEREDDVAQALVPAIRHFEFLTELELS